MLQQGDDFLKLIHHCTSMPIRNLKFFKECIVYLEKSEKYFSNIHYCFLYIFSLADKNINQKHEELCIVDLEQTREF